jgi:hypothetical protein
MTAGAIAIAIYSVVVCHLLMRARFKAMSSRYGASIGGLFLALPAIFCASATLIEKHEIRRKKEAGFNGHRRGQKAAALDAAGAALGALGMLAFALVFFIVIKTSIFAAFVMASTVWLIVSVAAWCARRKTRRVCVDPLSSRVKADAG